MKKGLIDVSEIKGEVLEYGNKAKKVVVADMRAPTYFNPVTKKVEPASDEALIESVKLINYLPNLHDIGNNIIVVMLKGAGYDVTDLGVDCSLEKYVAAIEDGAQVLLCSALLTTTMPRMKEVAEYCKEHHPEVKIIIGGAPVTEDFAKLIDVYAYGDDASIAAEIVEDIFNSKERNTIPLTR